MNKNFDDYTETQKRLLQTSSELFGKYGYDGLSIRQIASATSVNIAAIGYHFGGKKELYRECLYYMTARVANEFKPAFTHIEDVLNSGKSINSDEIEKIICTFIEKSVNLLTDETHKFRFMFYLREKFNPILDDADVFQEKLIKPIRKVLAELISRLTGLDVKSERMQFLLFNIIGQFYALIISKSALLENLGQKKMDKNFIKKISGNMLIMIKNETVLNEDIYRK
ncbi:MAG TPA: CerR family C-terminal domain-containing protein [Victivallales bacterium]|nr:CerR family C-terminal domain-containing protein [Victivallales bacterium]